MMPPKKKQVREVHQVLKGTSTIAILNLLEDTIMVAKLQAILTNTYWATAKNFMLQVSLFSGAMHFY